MYLVGVGLLLIGLKLLELGPMGDWSWWLVLSPFAAAVAWWAWADASGYTKRREMEAMDARKEERRKKNMIALGQQDRKRR